MASSVKNPIEMLTKYILIKYWTVLNELNELNLILFEVPLVLREYLAPKSIQTKCQISTCHCIGLKISKTKQNQQKINDARPFSQN